MNRFAANITEISLKQASIHVLTSCVIFATLFYLLKEFIFISKDRNKVFNIHSRVVSMVHGILSASLAFIHLMDTKFDVYSEANILTVKLAGITIGYFMYDFLLCLYYGKMDKQVFVHHLGGIMGISSIAMSSNSAFYCSIGLFLAEVNNPFMNFRYFLTFYGFRHTKMYELVDMIYCSTYIICRGILGTFIFILIMVQPKTNWVMVFFFGLLYIQSWVFILKMVSILKNKRSQYLCRKKENILYEWLVVNPEIKNLSYYKNRQKKMW